jgi:hypothetical protein
MLLLEEQMKEKRHSTGSCLCGERLERSEGGEKGKAMGETERTRVRRNWKRNTIREMKEGGVEGGREGGREGGEEDSTARHARPVSAPLPSSSERPPQPNNDIEDGGKSIAQDCRGKIVEKGGNDAGSREEGRERMSLGGHMGSPTGS